MDNEDEIEAEQEKQFTVQSEIFLASINKRRRKYSRAHSTTNGHSNSTFHSNTPDHINTIDHSTSTPQTTTAGGLVVSEFSFYNPLLDKGNGQEKKLLFDRDGDLILKRLEMTQSVISIEHQCRTTLDSVGHQVWRGALLLSDLVLDTRRIKPGSVVLELGSGTGVSAIAAALHAKQVVCTDININGLLDQIQRNISLNEDLIQCPIAVHELDFYSGGCNLNKELEDSFSKVNIIIAADVVYDDDLTDAFVSTLNHIMRIPPRKTAYIALEKRYVFTLTDLNTVAPCYEHFVSKITSLSLPWVCELLPLHDIKQRFQYERLPQLVVWKIRIPQNHV